MTAHEVRVGPATDPARFVATDQAVWFGEVGTATAEERLTGLPADQLFAATVADDDTSAHPGAATPVRSTYAGVYGVFPMRLPVPGPHPEPRQVACAGLTWVGVHPDHRRRGVLTALMRHHLDQVRGTAGTHVSALHASEPAIYGRFGYGLASLELEVSLGRGTALTAPHLDAAAAEVATRLETAADPGVAERMHACHLAVAGVGEVVGAPAFYHRLTREPPEQQRDKEPLRVLFARRDGQDVGWALLRRTHEWQRARPAGELRVTGLTGGPAARLALLRRLVDFDLTGTVKLGGLGVDDPVLLWAGGPRATADVATYDSLWVRLVDLPEALADRTWSAACDVVVDVADATAPWNAGRWRIRVDDAGQAQVERTTDAADLSLPVAVLGAAYLGGGNLVAACRAGLVAEHRPGAVGALWQGLRTDLAPTASLVF